ncbi:MAG TPA: bifunctional lysylphosphatidylglycerol flippase/synthetase MprF [archaeon]|nr:bifunctional lysylphosphatidylglycerol flippase/synthetase MprF [archaeon]
MIVDLDRKEIVSTMKKSLLQIVSSLFGLTLFAVVLWVLFHELRHYHYQDIVREVHNLPAFRLLLACGLTALNYLVLTGYDTLAFRYIRYPMPYRRAAPASFVAYAFTNNIGFSVLSGGFVRYRLYSAWGVSARDVARIIAFCGFTFWLGFLAVGGMAFLFTQPSENAHLLHSTLRPLGILLLGLLAGYLIVTVKRTEPLRFRQWEFPLPNLRLGSAQVGLSTIDWLLASGVLYALLPSSVSLTYPHFVALFMLAMLAGSVSSVPGGLGVFETVLLLLLSGHIETTAALGSLLAFRVIYYLLPLLLASGVLFGYEIFHRREAIETAVRRVSGAFAFIAPHLLAATTFLGGVILLFSGATPSVHGRLAWLNQFLPLSVIELSHFLSSLAGAGLLILAWGLQRRLDSAYHLSLALLALGALGSILKGFDYEEAIALTVFFAVLLPSHRHFFRQVSLASGRFTPGWIVLIGLILVCAGWLGLFSHKHVEYSNDLWWQFALHGDAPRFLRAGVGVVSLALLFALARILKPAPVAPALPSPEDLEQARAIINENPYTVAHLALLGDKSLLFSESMKAFIMYGVEKKSWVAMGDPVGPKEEALELAWSFREICHRHGGWTVFYQIRPGNIPLYLDLGLTLSKLGEEGRVSLESFSLEGSSRKSLRHIIHSVEREGGVFEIVSPERVPGLLPELKRVSDQWLEEKHTREKRFSLGFFNEGYLSHLPMAVVRKEGRPVGFANLLATSLKEELSIDLMRYSRDAPKNLMEYLLVQLMLWGKEKGYRWFSLGMAPLSGLEDRALAPLWSKLGALVFRHGEHFYNFQGLRQYKEKFDPVWEPRYLASPGGFALPQILTHVASLISGGLRGVVSR